MIGRRQAIGRLGAFLGGVLAALGIRKVESEEIRRFAAPRTPVDTYDEIGVLEFSTKDGTLRRCWTEDEEKGWDRSDRANPAYRLFEPVGPDAAKLQPFTVHRTEVFRDAGYENTRGVGPEATLVFDEGPMLVRQAEVMPDRRLRLTESACGYGRMTYDPAEAEHPFLKVIEVVDVRIRVPYLVNYRKA